MKSIPVKIDSKKAAQTIIQNDPQRFIKTFQITTTEFDYPELPEKFELSQQIEINIRKLANLYKHRTIDNKDGTFTHIFS